MAAASALPRVPFAVAAAIDTTSPSSSSNHPSPPQGNLSPAARCAVILAHFVKPPRNSTASLRANDLQEHGIILQSLPLLSQPGPAPGLAIVRHVVSDLIDVTIRDSPYPTTIRQSLQPAQSDRPCGSAVPYTSLEWAGIVGNAAWHITHTNTGAGASTGASGSRRSRQQQHHEREQKGDNDNYHMTMTKEQKEEEEDYCKQRRRLETQKYGWQEFDPASVCHLFVQEGERTNKAPFPLLWQATALLLAGDEDPRRFGYSSTSSRPENAVVVVADQTMPGGLVPSDHLLRSELLCALALVCRRCFEEQLLRQDAGAGATPTVTAPEKDRSSSSSFVVTIISCTGTRVRLVEAKLDHTGSCNDPASKHVQEGCGRPAPALSISIARDIPVGSMTGTSEAARDQWLEVIGWILFGGVADPALLLESYGDDDDAAEDDRLGVSDSLFVGKTRELKTDSGSSSDAGLLSSNGQKKPAALEKNARDPRLVVPSESYSERLVSGSGTELLGESDGSYE